ncbi:MAG: hypothetical protein IJ571_07845 [Ruminococcus sp.]|nr:hypothetical protein [Ruminococcus sp.]
MSKLQSVLNDEESMKQVKELADMLSGGSADQPQLSQPLSQPAAPAIDPAMLMKIQSVLSQASKPDKNIDLLMALRPLLKDENKTKLDRIIRLLRLVSLYPAIKESGILGGDLLGIL